MNKKATKCVRASWGREREREGGGREKALRAGECWYRISCEIVWIYLHVANLKINCSFTITDWLCIKFTLWYETTSYRMWAHSKPNTHVQYTPFHSILIYSPFIRLFLPLFSCYLFVLLCIFFLFFFANFSLLHKKQNTHEIVSLLTNVLMQKKEQCKHIQNESSKKNELDE